MAITKKQLIEQNKLVKGKLDQYGYIEDYSTEEADQFVESKILKPLFGIK